MMGNGCMSRRSFVLGATTLGIAGALGLSGCGEEPEETYAVGDTVESELVRLTLDDAQLAIALNNSFASFGPEGTTYNEDYFLPKPHNEAEDEDNPFVAAKGYTLVWFEVVLENLDRESVDLPLTFVSEGESAFVEVSYDGENYTSDDFSDEPFTNQFGFEIIDLDGAREFGDGGTSNILLGTEGRELHRGYVEVPFEPESLDDPFSITFALPNSDDTFESFTFEVNG